MDSGQEVESSRSLSSMRMQRLNPPGSSKHRCSRAPHFIATTCPNFFCRTNPFEPAVPLKPNSPPSSKARTKPAPTSANGIAVVSNAGTDLIRQDQGYIDIYRIFLVRAANHQRFAARRSWNPAACQDTKYAMPCNRTAPMKRLQHEWCWSLAGV